MPDRDPSTRVPLEVDPDTFIRIGWISAALGFTIAIVSAIGEVAGWAAPISRAAEHVGLGQMLGWWDLVGELGMTVGSMLGIVATLGTLSFTASRDQAAAIQEGIDGLGDGIDGLNTGIDGLSSGIDDVGEAVSANGDKLDTLDAIDDDLDRVQVALDEQTGVLDNQLTVLEQLRDAA